MLEVEPSGSGSKRSSLAPKEWDVVPRDDETVASNTERDG